MIWDIIQESTFDQYFDNASQLQIETLLLDQNIITQFKNLNPKLIQFYQQHRHNFLTQMINYTIQMPSPNDSEQRIQKLPYVSSQVLSIDNAIIYNPFLYPQEGHEDYFKQLMGILSNQQYKQSAQNEILLGYFLKIIQNFYKCEKKQTAKRLYEFRAILFQHLSQESIGQLFKMMIILLDTEEKYFLEARLNLIRKLIQLLVAKKSSQEVKVTISQILVDVIRKFQTFSSGDQIFEELLNSKDLLQIFNPEKKESIAANAFLTGYLRKALQKICTSNDSQKAIFQLPEKHRSLLKQFLIQQCREFPLHKQKETTLTHTFNNQSHQKVSKINPRALTILTLTKLSLENGITGFLEPDFIQALWRIVKKHPTNDIIKVKVFEVFELLYVKKDHQGRANLEKSLGQEVLELFAKEKNMFGGFLYQLVWKVMKRRGVQIKPETQDKQKWEQFIQYCRFQQKLQQQAQKVVDRYSNHTKVTKLIVDEEDTTPTLLVTNDQTVQQAPSKMKVQEEEAIKSPIIAQKEENSQEKRENYQAKKPEKIIKQPELNPRNVFAFPWTSSMKQGPSSQQKVGIFDFPKPSSKQPQQKFKPDMFNFAFVDNRPQTQNKVEEKKFDFGVLAQQEQTAKTSQQKQIGITNQSSAGRNLKEQNIIQQSATNSHKTDILQQNNITKEKQVKEDVKKLSDDKPDPSEEKNESLFDFVQLIDKKETTNKDIAKTDQKSPKIITKDSLFGFQIPVHNKPKTSKLPQDIFNFPVPKKDRETNKKKSNAFQAFNFMNSNKQKKQVKKNQRNSLQPTFQQKTSQEQKTKQQTNNQPSKDEKKKVDFSNFSFHVK